MLLDAFGICEEILASKKYASLHRPLVLRICEEEYSKYDNDKERVKAAKNTLHTMYGAFLTAGIYKKAGKLLDQADELDSDKLKKMLHLHISTRERMSCLHEFYGFIFDNIKQPESVMDIGCGFNPFTLQCFPQKPAKYYALDIDSRIADLNNRYFKSLGMPELAKCMDIAADTPDITADAAFLFKLLPLIDRQAKGRSIKLLKETDAQFLVITYPTKSLTGKEKGMQTFYAAAFEETIKGNLFISAKKQIGHELVYIIDKSL